VFADKNRDNKPCFSIGKGKKALIPNYKVKWGRGIVSFLYSLQEKVTDHGFQLQIRTEHKRKGTIFRGTPIYRDAYWRDWVLVNWGDDTYLPAQIWCFVVIEGRPDSGTEDSDLSNESQNVHLYHGGIPLKKGTYAVVEKSVFVTDKESLRKSDIFVPICKKVAARPNAHGGWRRVFYLVDVEAFMKPCVVVPDIGGRTGNEFFVVKQRADWAEEYKEWLNDPHEDDVIGPEEPQSSYTPPPF
jgi:hypothetical protein